MDRIPTPEKNNINVFNPPLWMVAKDIVLDKSLGKTVAIASVYPFQVCYMFTHKSLPYYCNIHGQTVPPSGYISYEIIREGGTQYCTLKSMLDQLCEHGFSHWDDETHFLYQDRYECQQKCNELEVAFENIKKQKGL